ncbi:hypothetical protein [Salinimicrobium sp. HB62]|nr:hypothetical protein [Salinimicrobium sp. HB62]
MRYKATADPTSFYCSTISILKILPIFPEGPTEDVLPAVTKIR